MWIYCEDCENLEYKKIDRFEHCYYCNKYNKKLSSERLTDGYTMRDVTCVYKCEECKSE